MVDFNFSTSVKLVEITGRRAATLPELLAGIRDVDGSVIYHHTHHFVLQHHYLLPQPPNEFAVWVGDALQEGELAERLLAINTIEYHTIRDLRERLAAVIEDYLSEDRRINIAPEGREFHFMRARTFILPTPHVARNLAEFREALSRISLNSVYHHMFEARLRLERGINDFSAWLDWGLGERELAASIARLDPYTFTLEDLRRAILERVAARMKD
jgi:hypothetical protein